MSDELERIWMEVIVALSSYYPSIFREQAVFQPEFKPDAF
jgi:hypothetical protein